MAWELGAGYGHLGPMLTLARPLAAAGHRVSLAVRDVAAAEAVLGGSGLPFYAAPANVSPSGDVALHSFAQILLSTAFNREDELCARVRAWQALYDMLRPDLLVCDHAPTALLAARGRNIPCVVSGNGFVVPPDVTPLPELRDWDPEDPAVLQAAEAQARDMANAVLERTGGPKLTKLADLYGSATPALFTLRELDNYAALRGEAEYRGILPGPGGEAPRWPEGPGKRVFFYGQPFASLPEVLESLSAGPHRTLAYLPKLAPELRGHASAHLAFAERLQDMAAVSRECDAAVMTNGHSTTAAMLLAGKPVVLLPRHLEMYLIANSVQQIGAGLAAPGLKPQGILDKLDRVLHEMSFTARAHALAARYPERDPMAPVRGFQALAERLLEEY
ncbi:MAG TPA: nucleotide disphospho-sugar-binding domain-containing protein [Gammaproteobacteria bacterium]|nr:nucleotide disphospho-sugar-binding domain-containing protein [Gammaproteobacteria bacterium]